MKAALATVLIALILSGSAWAGPRDRRPDRGGGSVDSSLLVALFQQSLGDRDPEKFRQSVVSSFQESTLARLVREGDVDTRRAAVYALGMVGSFRVNSDVAAGLRDTDPIVRSMADRALRAIWFRADTVENNESLRKVMVMIELGRYDEAIRRSSELVRQAPGFAEAYNQRAIAYFFSGRTPESAEDCRKVIELNPYHLGALSGLGQCLIRQNQRTEAVKVFRRALTIDPYNTGLKETIAELEADR